MTFLALLTGLCPSMRLAKFPLAALVGLSTPGWAIEISTPTGVQLIGQRLELSAPISDIPMDAISQLRSSGLKARVLSGFDDEGAGGRRVIDSDLLVHFQSTIGPAGLIELASRRVMDDAVVNLELISECPLISFTAQWSLILDRRGERAASISPMPVTRSTASNAFDRNFRFEHSASLSQTKSAPLKQSVYTPVPTTLSSGANRMETVDNQQHKIVFDDVERALPQHAESNSEPDAVLEKPLQIAALGGDLSAHGLVESKPRGHMPVLNEEALVPGDDADHLIRYTHTIILSIGLALLGILMGLFFRQNLLGKRLGRRFLQHGVPDQVSEPHFKQDADLFASHRSQKQALGNTTPEVSGGRLIESLMGEQKTQLEESEFSSSGEMFAKGEAENLSSIKASLEAIRRADSPLWALPDEFQDLIEHRNSQISVCQTPHTLALKCQLGLIELAHQEALKGRLLTEKMCSELIDLLLGQFVDMSSFPVCETVPDLLGSYLQSKWCEVPGQDVRRQFDENLKALTNIVKDAGFCFHTAQWISLVCDRP